MVGLHSYTLLLLPPFLILFLYSQNGLVNQPASHILFPRFDEHTPEYYMNLESMQYAFLFFIRIYDNLAYHLQHLTLSSTTYKVLFLFSLGVSCFFYLFGKWLIMAMGLMLLLNKTWVGSSLEIMLQFLIEVLQTGLVLVHRSTAEKKVPNHEPIQVSLYENQRWWAGTGYTSQVSQKRGKCKVHTNNKSAFKIRKICMVKYHWSGTIAIKRRHAFTYSL